MPAPDQEIWPSLRRASAELTKNIVVGAIALLSCALVPFLLEDAHPLLLLPGAAAIFGAGVFFGQWLWGAIGDVPRTVLRILVRKWQFLILLLGLFIMGITKVFAPDRYAETLERNQGRQQAQQPRLRLLMANDGSGPLRLTADKARSMCEQLGEGWQLATRDEFFDGSRAYRAISKTLTIPAEGFPIWSGTQPEISAYRVTEDSPDPSQPGTVSRRLHDAPVDETPRHAVCVRK